MGRKPETPASCRHRTLAKGSTAHVQACVECGTISMNLGAVTLRFDPSALESLWNTVGEALIALHTDAKTEGSALAHVPTRGSDRN